MSKGQRGSKMAAASVKRLRTLVDERGLASVVKDTGASKAAIIRAMAGLEVLSGTAALIERTLRGES